MNSRFVEYMEFLKLLFAQNARFVSNIPIFPTGFFTLILLRVLVRVKIRVIIIFVPMCLCSMREDGRITCTTRIS